METVTVDNSTIGSLPRTPLVDALLARCTYPPAGSMVTCGVSGGADSLALLVLAVAAGCEVTAIHVDHGLRGGSEIEVNLVERVAGLVGAKFVSVKVDVGAGSGVEARARELRYGVLPRGVLVGHHADDQAETILLNMLRGSGLDGLCGMRSVDAGIGAVQRPLINLRREELHALLRELDLEWFEDPSNQDQSYRRNRVRSCLLPLLNDLSGKDMVPLLERQARLLSLDAEALDQWACSIDVSNIAVVRSVPEAVARRALRNWLRSYGGVEEYPPSSADIDRVLQVVLGECVATCITGDIVVRRSKGRLSATRSARRVHSDLRS